MASSMQIFEDLDDIVSHSTEHQSWKIQLLQSLLLRQIIQIWRQFCSPPPLCIASVVPMSCMYRGDHVDVAYSSFGQINLLYRKTKT